MENHVVSVRRVKPVLFVSRGESTDGRLEKKVLFTPRRHERKRRKKERRQGRNGQVERQNEREKEKNSVFVLLHFL